MQVGIGGTNQPDIDVYRIDCSQSGDALLFDGRQQLGLHGQGQVTDFIQKQRTPRSRFHSARLGFSGIRESTLLVPEELTFEQLLRNTSQVDGNKDLLPTGREEAQHACGQILSGTVFSQYEQVGIRIRKLVDGFFYLLHGGGVANQFRNAVVSLQGLYLVLQPSYFLA